MQLIEKVLLAVDFSATTEPAVAQATELARRFGGEIIIVHALEHLGGRQQGEAKVAALRDTLHRAQVPTAEPVVLHGDPFRVILSTANAHDVNVIVLGAAPKGLAMRIIEGNTANHVIHRAVMPVWCAHAGSPAPNQNRILCAVDFSSASEQALKTAVHLLRNGGGSLHIVHVIEHGDDAVGRFERYLQRFDLAGIEHSQELSRGVVHEEILAASQRCQADLLVMGSYGCGSVLEQFIGNNADRLVRKAACSVLTVKQQDLFKIMHDTWQARDEDAAHTARRISASVNELADFIESHYERGQELIEKGFLEDAIVEFKLCLEQDPLFTHAYEGISTAYERLGRPRKAQQYKELARDHRKVLWQQKVQADVRRQHSLFRSGDHD